MDHEPTQTPKISSEIPKEIIDEFSSYDNDEVQLLETAYRDGYNFDNSSTWDRYKLALDNHPEHKAYLDILRESNIQKNDQIKSENHIETENTQEKITFRANTFEEAKKIPNMIDENKVNQIFQDYVKRDKINLSYGFYKDNNFEIEYSKNHDLEDEYTNSIKKLREKYSGLGFSVSDNSLVFAEYISPEAIRLIKEGKFNSPTRRIYLNPHPQDVEKIFDAFLSMTTKEKLAIQSKVSETPMVEVNWVSQHRDDHIVIYIDEAQADKVLAITQELYTQFSDSFIDSRVPFAATELAPGFGVADEKIIKDKDGEKYSATKYREALISRMFYAMPKSMQDIVKSGNYDKKLVSSFTENIQKYMSKVGINKNNWSFYD